MAISSSDAPYFVTTTAYGVHPQSFILFLGLGETIQQILRH